MRTRGCPDMDGKTLPPEFSDFASLDSHAYLTYCTSIVVQLPAEGSIAMSRTPDFSVQRQDLRDRFVEVLLTIVMVLLAIDGWLEYIVR
jgi:hypothetical protein